jgi:hypothetical protein
LGHELTLENREFGHTARSATSRFSFAGSSLATDASLLHLDKQTSGRANPICVPLQRPDIGREEELRFSVHTMQCMHYSKTNQWLYDTCQRSVIIRVHIDRLHSNLSLGSKVQLDTTSYPVRLPIKMASCVWLI